MIRDVTSGDAQAIDAIYNDYILNGVETFETEPLDVEQMLARIETISAEFPYFVFETDGGEAVAYAYAHKWKERDAYAKTLETSVYVAREFCGSGIGRKLHEKLGFKKVSHFEKVGIKFGRELDVIDLELRL